MPEVDATDVFVTLLTRMSPEDAVQWLSSPHRRLGGRAPHSLIAEGRKHEVLALLKGAEGPAQ
jgi:uncharacterized protein (DUF2384 family)